MPEATFNDPLQGIPWGLAAQGWRAHFDGNGNVVGYIRDVALDDSRGDRQSGVTGDFAIEYVDAKDWNGGAPAPDDVKYQTGGTNIIQNDNVPGWAKAYVAGVIGTALGGAALTQAGLLGAAPGATAGTGTAAGSSTWAPFVGEDLVGAIGAGSTVPAGYTIPAGLGGGVAGPGGFSLANNSASLFGGDIAGEAGSAAAASNAAGNAITGIGPGAATNAATNAVTNAATNAATGGLGSVIDKITGGNASLSDWAKLLLPVLGGAGLAYEAKQNSGPQGYGPAMESIANTMNKPAYQPTFSSGLGSTQDVLAMLNKKRYY